MPVSRPKSTAHDALVGIDLVIDSHVDSNENFDSMSTKIAASSKPDETSNISRLIDPKTDDNDDNDHDNDSNEILNQSADYDFLNNW